MLYKENEVEVKSVGTRQILGTGIRFTDETQPDSYNEWFWGDTVTGLKNGESRPFLMEHGWSSVFNKTVVGDAVYEKKTGEGWEYLTTFTDTKLGNLAYDEILSKRYKSSAGAAGHTVQRTMIKDTYRLDTWLVAEQSATQTPADKGNPPIVTLKSDDILAVLMAIQTQNQRDMEVFTKSVVDKMSTAFNEIIQKTNPQLERLREMFLKLQESFKEGNEALSFEITADWLADFEEATKPIELIQL